jgi:hypothetical protein
MGGIYLPKPSFKGFFKGTGGFGLPQLLLGPGLGTLASAKMVGSQAKKDIKYATSPPEEETYTIPALKKGKTIDPYGNVVDDPNYHLKEKQKRRIPVRRPGSSLLTNEPARSSLLTGGY